MRPPGPPPRGRATGARSQEFVMGGYCGVWMPPAARGCGKWGQSPLPALGDFSTKITHLLA